MTRWFNTAGPCVPSDHYMIPASVRLPEVPRLVARKSCFVVHAPRQTGKTTALQALASELTASGRHAALLFSCEAGRAWGDDIGAATRAILDEIRAAAEDSLPAGLRPPPWPAVSEGTQLGMALRAWAQACPRPLVLFFDEIDALQGRTLISVLSQLRSGYRGRPDNFPASVALCGLRDVRDYKVASGGDPSRLGTSSPFNIKVESLRLGDFTLDEVRELYGQHTAETGQTFTPEAMERAFHLTAGQPWLVNALAYEIVDKIQIPTSTPITVDHVEQAKERLILARATHLDSLADTLTEPRVRRVMEPVLAGTVTVFEPFSDDVLYARDLGLITQTSPVEVANPIYREVIARVLADGLLDYTDNVPRPRSFVLPDGRLDFPRLLEEFAAFWTANGDILTTRQQYHEAGPHLVLMAYLQRVVNGGGYVDREYGVGRGRIDLLLRWPHPAKDGTRAWQREALELKAWRQGDPDPLREGLGQLDAYLDRLGLDTGILAVFDRRPNAEPIDRRTTITHTTSPTGRTITLFRG
ncbi:MULTISPECIES: ATP-binding protein [unclassified Frankia]|uniref:ATP-binding protein n=1 Tax=unclassified Frankia TaxID=2632575 RepID=UPI002AD22F6A|nr:MULTISPECIES: ATP-binding protein [unclassified Frankia]